MAQNKREDSLREIAAFWHERVGQEKVAADIRSACDAWVAESPEHAAAYRAIEQTWAQLKSAAHDPQILSLRHEAALRLTRQTSAILRPLGWVAAAAIIVALGTALWTLAPRAAINFSPLAWLEENLHARGDRHYVTNTGERLTIVLDDGSQATLNTQSELHVAYTRATRSVHLSRGQALFEVAKSKARPFVVQAQDRRFIAVGTAFDVHIEREQVKVTMLEGTVRAESIAPGSPIRATVSAGEQLVTAAQGVEDHVRRVDPERETSWRHGQVNFENTPLGEAIDELNRYSSTHIELADPRLADLRLSGTFATGGTSIFIEAVTAYFPIQIEHADERTVTLKARD
jgi:transmembrane sensor